MKITKYKHACFTVEIDNQLLVIDPGVWTTDFVSPSNVTVIIITHEHPDHFNPDVLADIYGKNPNSILLSLDTVVQKMPDHKSQAVKPNDVIKIGAFDLRFYGGSHAIIHNSIPAIGNIGVLINNTIYYPGDSFTVPDDSVDVLALPVGAPWLKVSETMDFLTAIKPKFTFPTHDAVLSKIGKDLVDNRMIDVTKNFDGEYKRIDGTTIEI